MRRQLICILAAALLLGAAPDARPGNVDTGLWKQLLYVARAQRIAARLAYLRHAQFVLPFGPSKTLLTEALQIPEEDLVDPWGTPYEIKITDEGKRWRLAGRGPEAASAIVIEEGETRQSPYPALRLSVGEMDVVAASQEAHARLDASLDAPIARNLDSIRLEIGVIEYFGWVTHALSLEAGLNGFRAAETQLSMRRVARRLEEFAQVHGSLPTGKWPAVYGLLIGEQSRNNRFLLMKDEWRGEFLLKTRDSHYVLVSGGADRHFEPTSWMEPLTVADPVEDLVLIDGRFTRAPALSDYMQFFLAEAEEAKSKVSAGPPYRVGGDVTAPEVISRVDPPYTREAAAAHVNGIMIAELVVNERGDVLAVKILMGLHPTFDDDAVAALKKWRFRPGRRNGEPVAVYYPVTLSAKEK